MSIILDKINSPISISHFNIFIIRVTNNGEVLLSHVVIIKYTFLIIPYVMGVTKFSTRSIACLSFELTKYEIILGGMKLYSLQY